MGETYVCSCASIAGALEQLRRVMVRAVAAAMLHRENLDLPLFRDMMQELDIC